MLIGAKDMLGLRGIRGTGRRISFTTRFLHAPCLSKLLCVDRLALRKTLHTCDSASMSRQLQCCALDRHMSEHARVEHSNLENKCKNPFRHTVDIFSIRAENISVGCIKISASTAALG